MQTGCLFRRVGFIKREPTLKSLGMVSGLCELRQHAKEQVCFGCVILVSDPAGPAAAAAAQTPQGAPLSSPQQVRREITRRTSVPPTSSRPTPCLPFKVPLLVSLLVLGRGQKPAPRVTFPPNVPSCPAVAFGFCSVYFKKIHWLASVFGWLACDKHLSTTYILEYLFSS